MSFVDILAIVYRKGKKIVIATTEECRTYLDIKVETDDKTGKTI